MTRNMRSVTLLISLLLLYDFSMASQSDVALLQSINMTSVNDTNTLSIEMASMERVVSMLVPLLFGCIFITGLIGNALVVLVVARNAAMRNTTNLLILNLAVADLLFIVFCVPFTACDYALAYWPFGDLWCRVVQYLILVLACASIYTLVLMSLDRFLAVVHPLQSMRLRNTRNATYALIALWTIILTTCAPALLTHGVIEYEYGSPQNMYLACRYTAHAFLTYAAFQFTFFCVSYVAPLFVAFALYMGMLQRLWTSGRAPACSSRRRRKKVTRMVVIVLLIFAVSWAPIQLMLVCRSLRWCSMRSGSAVAAQIAAQVLAYMNSCVNPILYAFLSENFRKAFRKAILCHLGGPMSSGLGAPSTMGGNTVVGGLALTGGVSTQPSSAAIELHSMAAVNDGFNRRKSSAQV